VSTRGDCFRSGVSRTGEKKERSLRMS